MKISNKHIEQIHRLYGAQQRRRQTSAAAGASRTGDKVEISTESRAIEAAWRALDATPAVRQDLVDRLKGALERGEYDVDSREVARKMLAYLLADEAGES